MGRMIIELLVGGKKRRTFGALVDTGAGVTVLSKAIADIVGIKCATEDTLDIGGASHPVCYRKVDLHIPGTDCLVENMRVAIIAKSSHDIPGAILGADFLQRTGAVLDLRKDRHAIVADVEGRDSNPPAFVKPKRLRMNRRRNGRS